LSVDSAADGVLSQRKRSIQLDVEGFIFVTRSDILSAYRRRIKQDETQRPAIRVSRLSKKIRRIPTRLFR
jgi:hypothetical protein